MPALRGWTLQFLRRRDSGKLRRLKVARIDVLSGSRYVLAVCSGLMLALSFPKVGLAGLAWIAPAMMAAAGWGRAGWERFRIGYVAGLTSWLGSLYWLLLIPYRWHGLPLGPALGWLALGGVLAVYSAAWVWVVSPQSTLHSPQSKVQSPSSFAKATEDKKSKVQSAESRVQSPESNTADRINRFDDEPLSTWSRRTGWALGGAAMWVALEMARARVLGGFPWNLLGDSQYRMLPLIQLSSVTGVYGISFLMVWFSLSLVSAGQMILKRPGERSVWVSEIFLSLMASVIACVLGFHHLRSASLGEQDLKVTLVQPSIPQTVIWDPEKEDERFVALVHLTQRALTNRTDLLIWPESAIPRLLRYDTNTLDVVRGLARHYGVWMIVGSDDKEPRPGATSAYDADYFNCAFLISPEGRLVDRYRKRSLVMFGEYIPFQSWLPFLKWFTPIEGGYTPGNQGAEFGLNVPDHPPLTASVLICFEDTFPQLGRNEHGADFLVNITNDGWFGESAAQRQHAAAALFRAVENGVPLIRCANNGLSCWIDENGRLQQVLRDGQGTVYGDGYMTVNVPMPAPGAPNNRTFYSRHGDWFGWTCVGIATVVAVLRGTAGAMGALGWYNRSVKAEDLNRR